MDPQHDPHSGASTKRHLVRAAGLLGLMTLASRVLGLIRDILSAKAYGTTWQWDAFVYSFMLPNFFRRIVGEGALSSAFIPVYSQELQEKGQEQAFRYASLISSVAAGGLAIFLILIEVLLFVLLRLDLFPERLRFTMELLRFMFPYLWFMSLYALAMGILNCHKIFFAPSLGPVILDLVWIAGVIVVPFLSGDVRVQLHWLAVIILISGAIQWITQWPDLKRIGFRFRWICDLCDAAFQKTVHLLLPSILSFAIVQINLLVDSTLAFLVGPGANSALWYGNRLMQFPLGVFAITMGTALLPTIAAQAAAKNFDAAKKSLSFSLRSVFLIILPSSVGLIALSRPIVQMLFERGEFDSLSTIRTAAVVVCYSIGLFAYSGQKIIAAGFYALQDTRTPVKAGIIALLSNIALNLILMGPMKEAGLALATSIAGAIQFAVLLIWFGKKVPDFAFRELFVSFGKIFAASVLMGFFCWGTFIWMERLFPGNGIKNLTVCVFTSIAVSVVFFVFVCVILRVHEMKEALDWIRRRGKKTAPSHEG